MLEMKGTRREKKEGTLVIVQIPPKELALTCAAQ